MLFNIYIKQLAVGIKSIGGNMPLIHWDSALFLHNIWIRRGCVGAKLVPGCRKNSALSKGPNLWTSFWGLHMHVLRLLHHAALARGILFYFSPMLGKGGWDQGAMSNYREEGKSWTKDRGAGDGKGWHKAQWSEGRNQEVSFPYTVVHFWAAKLAARNERAKI